MELFEFESENNFIMYTGIGVCILSIGIYYIYRTYEDTILEKIDNQLIKWKETVNFYTNQLLLKFATQDSAIKTTKYY
jgi:multisubunit Na+/H+ antiporter MnhB subunit